MENTIQEEGNVTVPPYVTSSTMKETPAIVDKEVEALKAEIAELRNLVRETADKGRLYNYESSRAEKKPFRVKLSRFGGGIIVGWRTVKDELVKHPTTGKTVGEVQEYEVIIADDNGDLRKQTISGYPAFSDARYTERIEADVIGKKEDFKGEVTLDVKLPTGKVIQLDSRFVN